MAKVEKPPEKFEIDYEAIMGYLFLILGLSLLFLGSLGILLSILLFSKIYDDQVLLSEFYFFYTYMIILGSFLFFYHKRIIVKGYRS